MFVIVLFNFALELLQIYRQKSIQSKSWTSRSLVFIIYCVIQSLGKYCLHLIAYLLLAALCNRDNNHIKLALHIYCNSLIINFVTHFCTKHGTKIGIDLGLLGYTKYLTHRKPRINTTILVIHYTISLLLFFILLYTGFEFQDCACMFLLVLLGIYLSLMTAGNFFNCVFATIVGVKVNNKTLMSKRDDNIFEEYALSKVTMEIRNMWLLIFMSASYVLCTLAFCLLCFLESSFEPSFFSVSYSLNISWKRSMV